KTKDSLAAVNRYSDVLRRSDRDGSRCFPLFAPTQQTQRAKAGGEKWESSGKRSSLNVTRKAEGYIVVAIAKGFSKFPLVNGDIWIPYERIGLITSHNEINVPRIS